MTVTQAWRDGLRRVRRAPALIVGLWSATVLLALPMALVLRGTIAAHLGASLAAERAADGMNFDWWNEFLAQTGGLGQTFVPSILGFAAVLRNVSTIADGPSLPLAIAAVVFGNTLLSLFLLGGVLDRLARDRRVGASGFFATCGRFAFRFVRLGVLAALIYWALFDWLHPLLLDTIYGRLTRDLTVERTAFLYRLTLYLLFAIPLAAVNLWFDYAKVRMVVEDRRSAFGALAASARFIRRHPGATLGLYLLNALAFLLVLGAYALVAPGAWSGGWVLVGFAIAQVYIALRVAARLLFAASQIALFQSRLAHAGYVAAPFPAWPESAAAEAVRPL
jgi:hypothetical protein